MKKHDIFISYRREGGMAMAQLFYDRLTRSGYRVFLDIEAMRNGKFNTQLYNRIDECKDVLVILSKDSLKLRENPEDDWFRREIAHALKSGKNIIPIFLRDFVPPAKNTLPEDIAELLDYEGVTSSEQHFASVISRICHLLKARNRRSLRWISACGIFILMALLSASYLLDKSGDNLPSVYPSTPEEKQICQAAISGIILQGTTFDLLANAQRVFFSDVENSIHCESEADFKEAIATFENSLSQIHLDACKPSGKLLDDITRSPVSRADFEGAFQYLSTCFQSASGTCLTIKKILNPNSPCSKGEKLKILKLYKENLKLEAEIYAYGIMDLCRELSDESLKELKNKVVPRWTMLPRLSGTWTRDKAELERQTERSFNEIEKNIGELSAIVGNMNMTKNREAEQAKQKLIAQGATEKDAKRILEKIQINSNLQTKLSVTEQKLKEAKERLRKKYTPLSSDDAQLIWSKILLLRENGYKADALRGIQVLRGKQDPQFPETVCRTLGAWIEQQEALPFSGGVIACLFEAPATSHAFLKIGDIVSEMDGKPCNSLEVFRLIPGRTYRVWRLNSSGEFTSFQETLIENKPRVAFLPLQYEGN